MSKKALNRVAIDVKNSVSFACSNKVSIEIQVPTKPTIFASPQSRRAMTSSSLYINLQSMPAYKRPI
jgi:hypothetical protein